MKKRKKVACLDDLEDATNICDTNLNHPDLQDLLNGKIKIT